MKRSMDKRVVEEVKGERRDSGPQVTHLSLKLYRDGLDGPLLQRSMHEQLSGHAKGNLHGLADWDINRWNFIWSETRLSRSDSTNVQGAC